MNSLFGEFFRDFWPGFLALEKTAGGAGGGRGQGGPGGAGGEIFQGKNMKNTVLPLENSNPTSGKYYLLFTIQFRKNPKTYFRYYIILFKIALNSLFTE